MITVKLWINITKNAGLSIIRHKKILVQLKNMDEDILKNFEEQNKKLDQIHRSVESTRKYFLWTLIITAVVIVLPLIGLLVLIPQIIKIYSGSLLGL